MSEAHDGRNPADVEAEEAAAAEAKAAEKAAKKADGGSAAKGKD